MDLEVLDDNIKGLNPTLLISDAAHLIFDYHKKLDALQEKLRGKPIGTTKKGTGPAYSDKINRIGIRAGLLKNLPRLGEALEDAVDKKNQELEFYGENPIDLDQLIDRLLPLFIKYANLVEDTSYYLHESIKEGKKVVFEGAQGAMLDIDHGTYPDVTSSNTTTAGLLSGTGLGPRSIDTVVGVIKVYTTRVGGGIFPTEGEAKINTDKLSFPERMVVFSGDVDDPNYDKLVSRFLREEGDEFGATTGRPRRTGWLDLVALRKAIRINGINYLSITKLDVLDGIGILKVCTSYQNPVTKEEIKEFPNNQFELQGFEPVYKNFQGWESTKGIKKFKELPREAQDYIHFIREETDTMWTRIRNGPLQGNYIQGPDVQNL